MHFPRVTDTVNNLLNGMQNLTFAAFFGEGGGSWLLWLVRHTLFAFHVTPLGPSPFFLAAAPLSIRCLGINLFGATFFPNPSRFPASGFDI